MTLPMPKTKAILDRMIDEIKTDPSYVEWSGLWIGLREREVGEFEWIDGESMLDLSVWAPFGAGKPDDYPDDCVLVDSVYGIFMDTPCNHPSDRPLNYVCEKGKQYVMYFAKLYDTSSFPAACLRLKKG